MTASLLHQTAPPGGSLSGRRTGSLSERPIHGIDGDAGRQVASRVMTSRADRYTRAFRRFSDRPNRGAAGTRSGRTDLRPAVQLIVWFV